MALLRGKKKEMVFKAFESEIFSLSTDNYYSEKSEK